MFRICLLCLFASVLSVSAAADTVHRVHFSNPGKVLVWQDGAFAGQGSEIDLLSPEPVLAEAWRGAGSLDPIPASTTGLTNEIRLKVASNIGFIIEAGPEALAGEFAIDIVGQGPNAALDPVPSALNETIVFAQASKTASQRGTPESQAVELRIRWQGEAPALRVRTAAF